LNTSSVKRAFTSRENRLSQEKSIALNVFKRIFVVKIAVICLVIDCHLANGQQIREDTTNSEIQKESQQLSELRDLVDRWKVIDQTNPRAYFKLDSIQVSLRAHLGTSIDRSAEYLGLPDGLSVWSEWDRTCDIIRQKKALHLKDQKILPYWHQFFGYVHGRMGVSPPGTWKYYLMHKSIDQDRADFDGTICPSDDPEHSYEKEIDFQIDPESSDRSGTIRPKSNGQNAPWTSVIMSVDPSNPAVGSSGPGYSTIWYELTLVRERNYGVLWGISNGGIVYYIKFDTTTGKQLDKCYLQLLDSVYLEKPKKTKK
jgi:hypothetical protein